MIGSAWAAAGSSFVAFAAGAVVPFLPFFVTSGRAGHRGRGGHGRAGPVRHRRHRRGAHRRTPAAPGLRQLAIGAGAAVVTYALGRVFGATLG